MAVEATAEGYVALGFAEQLSQMFPADIVLGRTDAAGSSSPHTFYAAAKGFTAHGMEPSPGSPSWAYDTGVAQGSNGVTTLCFSRLLLDSAARASPDLRRGTAGGAAAAKLQAGSRRRLAQMLLEEGDSTIALNWAAGDLDELTQHPSGGAGGVWINLATGEALQIAGSGQQKWINAHGALMAVAWGLLLPLGALMPAHRLRYLNGVRPGDNAGTAARMITAHVACQWAGLAFFLGGLVVAYTKLGAARSTGTAAGGAHGAIGAAVVVAAGTQVALAHGARPAPDSPRRRWWDLLHHNLGRAVILLAWANVYIGIYAYHSSQWQASYREWVTPIAVVMGFLALAYTALRCAAPCGNGSASSRPVNDRLHMPLLGCAYTHEDARLSSKA